MNFVFARFIRSIVNTYQVSMKTIFNIGTYYSHVYNESLVNEISKMTTLLKYI